MRPTKSPLKKTTTTSRCEKSGKILIPGCEAAGRQHLKDEPVVSAKKFDMLTFNFRKERKSFQGKQ